MKKKISFTLFSCLAVSLVGMPCYAGVYTPNELIEGRLPSNDTNITLTLANGNWTKDIVLPQRPKDGDRVNIVSNTDYDSQVDGNIVGFNSIKIKTGDRIELVYKKVTDSTSAWTLKDELSPKNSGVDIPNNKKYIGYFVRNSDWANRLYLPEGKGVVEKIVIRSRAVYDTYIDSRMIAGNSDLKISTNQVVEFTWNSTLNKWSAFKQGELFSLKSSVRKLAFLDMSLDTSTQGADLYNNGRMQKPIEITFKACDFEDYDSNQYLCNPVTLTEDEIKYYIRLGLYNRNDGGYPDDLSEIYHEFVIDYKEDTRYEHRLPALSNYIMSTENKVQDESLHTVTLWLRYQTSSIDDQKNVTLCTFSAHTNQEGDGIEGAYTNDCTQNGSLGSIRTLRVIDGSYQGSIVNNPDVSKKKTEENELCDSRDECSNPASGWHIEDNSSKNIRYVSGNLYKYINTRPKHKFLPVINSSTTTLVAGCTREDKNDGVCHRISGKYSFFATSLQFGSTQITPVRYTTKNSNIFPYGSSDVYTFDTDSFDTERYGTFSIFSVLPIIRIKDTDKKSFVRWSGPHWAGSTRSSSMPIKAEIDDNYGNRFEFSATLYAEPGIGAAAGDSDEYALTRIKDEQFKPLIN